MSLVEDRVRSLDAYIDRFPILSEPVSEAGSVEASSTEPGDHIQLTSPRLDRLLGILKSLGTSNLTQSLLSPARIRQLLVKSGIPDADADLDQSGAAVRSIYETEVEWLIVSKAAAQLHGAILSRLLDQIIPLSHHIWYWEDVLGSYTYSSLYTVQTSPWRFGAWSTGIWRESIARVRARAPIAADADADADADAGGSSASPTQDGLARRWGRFYGIIVDSIRKRNFLSIQNRILSPVAFCRTEARRKQAQLQRVKEVTACALGILMAEGLRFPLHDQGTINHEDVKGTVERSVVLMDMILREARYVDMKISDWEEKIFSGVEHDPEFSVHIEGPAEARLVCRRLIHIIDVMLPAHTANMNQLTKNHGRPSPIVRYWLPVFVGAISSTTVLQLLVNRQADIIAWLTDFGSTARDFWFNWVVEPTRKVIQTIRHDQTSEIAIMSRDSLKADRESLERMVVDFAIDNPHFADAAGSALTDAQITAIRSKVAEGDVTPVLKAFEKDLRSPFTGAVRGDLVRSLLIQVQKTKVDLEVAMTGIDSLLKSQELVFGFVGLTPGVLVSIFTFQYLRGLLGGRSGNRRSRQAGKAVRVLRNIDRILTESEPTTENNIAVLTYKDHGLLLCEVQILRSLAKKLMPAKIEKEFLEDVVNLTKLKGIDVQIKALSRLRWAYARWLQ